MKKIVMVLIAIALIRASILYAEDKPLDRRQKGDSDLFIDIRLSKQ